MVAREKGIKIMSSIEIISGPPKKVIVAIEYSKSTFSEDTFWKVVARLPRIVDFGTPEEWVNALETYARSLGCTPVGPMGLFALLQPPEAQAMFDIVSQIGSCIPLVSENPTTEQQLHGVWYAYRQKLQEIGS